MLLSMNHKVIKILREVDINFTNNFICFTEDAAIKTS